MSADVKTIQDLLPVSGKRVLVRVDLNVPIVGGEVRDDFRIQWTLPTISALRAGGARVTLVSHRESPEDSLALLVPHLEKCFPVSFAGGIAAARAKAEGSGNGSVILLENLRHFAGETQNDPAFARELSSLGDFFVNEAFSVSHRPHASIVGVPKLLPSFAGTLFAEEVSELTAARTPRSPSLVVLGGAKFDTKLPLIERFLEVADRVFVGGALANDIFRARGLQVGKSRVSKNFSLPPRIVSHEKLVVPTDVVVSEHREKKTVTPDNIAPDAIARDAGPQTMGVLRELISNAASVLWNGPLGYYEDGFTEGTEALARLLAETSARTVVGGADTLAAIQKLGVIEKYSFVSTGGGAMLEFLAKGTLPGIEALKNSRI